MGLNVIMLGAPGAGKGTQADLVARRRGLPKISTGDILRQGIKDQVPVAMVAKAKMDRGELVDDETMVAIVRERLGRPDADAGFILDGFPRTVDQARALDRIIEEQGKAPLVVVDVAVPEAELVRRLAGRRICSTCGQNAGPGDGATCLKCGGPLVQRPDDSEAVVLERLRVYERSTRPLVDYYRVRPTFRTVNGAQSPDLVALELEAVIDDALGAEGRAAMGAQGLAGR
jgi:adenylate kinase